MVTFSQQRDPGLRIRYTLLISEEIVISNLIYGLLDFRLLSFSTSEDEVSAEGPDKLQLFPQAIRLRLDGLAHAQRDIIMTCLA